MKGLHERNCLNDQALHHYCESLLPPLIMRRVTLFTFGTCIIPLLLSACGTPTERVTERAIENATGGAADVEVQGGTTRVTTSEGTVTVGTQELPSDWPKDVAMYPGSIIQVAGTVTGQGNGALFLTNDSKENVLKFYQAELVKEGWKIDATADMGTISIISASKEKRTVAIQISASVGQTTITIGLEQKQQD
jgi:tRNA/tmRNA/rRNA uracil-C5-methylase (TrmA/RlmC/RlmD family)